MLIAIDWDGTITRDPEWASDAIRSALRRGHRVIIVTGRSPTEQIHGAPADVPVYYTDGRAKMPWLQFRGIQVDVWIENDPVRIFENDERLKFT